jgi:hypothetical protein
MKNAISLVATAWIPDSAWKAAVGGIASWYGHQVALTYLPGFISNLLINVTAANVTIGGTVLGAVVVAPLFTPTAVFYLSIAVACACFYVAVVIANLVEKLLCNRCCQSKAST